MERQPLPELVYTHTHTLTQAPMKSKDIIHSILYLSQNTEDEDWGSETVREFESETVGLPVGYYSVLDRRQSQVFWG